jgi:hypothetical protein
MLKFTILAVIMTMIGWSGLRAPDAQLKRLWVFIRPRRSH